MSSHPLMCRGAICSCIAPPSNTTHVDWSQPATPHSFSWPLRELDLSDDGQRSRGSTAFGMKTNPGGNQTIVCVWPPNTTVKASTRNQLFLTLCSYRVSDARRTRRRCKRKMNPAANESTLVTDGSVKWRAARCQRSGV